MGATYMWICRESSRSLDSDICQYLERHLHPPQHSWNNTVNTVQYLGMQPFPSMYKFVRLLSVFLSISLQYNSQLAFYFGQNCKVITAGLQIIIIFMIIIFSISQYVNEMSENSEKQPSNFPQTQEDVFKLLVLAD